MLTKRRQCEICGSAFPFSLSQRTSENPIAFVPCLRYDLTMQATPDLRRLTRLVMIDMALRRQRPGTGI